MKGKKPVPTVAVRYIKDCAGISAGTVKPLPIPLAAQMVDLGHCEYATAKEVEPKEEKKAPVTKELKKKIKTK